MQPVATKRPLDNKRSALLSSWELHTAHPSPGLPPPGAPRGARAFTRLLDRGRRQPLWDRGDSKPLLRQRGGAAQRPSLRSGPGRSRDPVHFKSQKSTLSGGGHPPCLPGAYSSSYYRSLPPRFPFVSFPIKGYFLSKHVRRCRSNPDIEGLSLLALSSLAGTMPNSLTGVG